MKSTLLLFGLTCLFSSVVTASNDPEILRGYVGPSGAQIHYRSVNYPRSTEVPLIALHLVPNSSQVFIEFMKQVPASRPVFAFDLPGFGMSDPTANDTIEEYAIRILFGVKQLGLEKYDLLGYHTGAAVAVEMERRASSQVRFMILAAVPILTEEERDRFAALPPIAFDEAGDYLKAEWQRSMQWRGPGQTVASVRRTFAEKMRPGARERGATAVVKYDLATPLAKLTKPLLVIRPKDDLWVATKRARGLVPDAQWLELPGYGHGLFEVAGPSLAERLERFLVSAASGT